MIDAYSKIIETYGKENFFNEGIESIIFIEDKLCKDRWGKIKYDFFNNRELYIRGYGRNSAKSDWFLCFYSHLVGNNNIKIDKSNNTKPTWVLENFTEYSKKKKKGKTEIQNFQISHLFGQTKNPLLFTAPWNIAYIPKYLDPFTGHETKGKYSDNFKEIFNKKINLKFEEYIKEYNYLISDLKNKGTLDSALHKTQESLSLSVKEFDVFKTNVLKELSEIKL